MTVDTPETMDEKALLDDFKGRYTKLRDENQQLVASKWCHACLTPIDPSRHRALISRNSCLDLTKFLFGIILHR